MSPGLVLRDQLREVGLADDLVAVDRDDHVASRRGPQALELDLLVPRLDARVVGRAPLDDLGHQRAGVDRKPEPIGELRIERLGGDADVGVLDAPVGAELVERALDQVDRDREADPLVASRGRVDLLVDADHAPVGVEQGAARVAGVDRGVGLDRALDLEGGQRLDRAVGRRDDADRQRLLLHERAADRRNRLAGLYRVAVSQLQRVQVEAIRVDLEQRDVGVRVEADDARGHLVAVGELDVDLLRLVDRCPPPLLSASVTTWAAVAISPLLEITKPDPSASDPPVPPSRVAPPPGRIERIVTTPGAAA